MVETFDIKLHVDDQTGQAVIEMPDRYKQIILSKMIDQANRYIGTLTNPIKQYGTMQFFNDLTGRLNKSGR
jgi:hypothetical protein